MDDFINKLPDELLCHILSYLTTKEAASTSLLSTRWRYLFAFLPNLELDDSVFLHPDQRLKSPLHPEGLKGFVYYINGKRMKLSTSFPDFVNRILVLQGNYPLHKFSLKMVNVHDPVDPDSFIRWIHKVLARGVSDFNLVMNLKELDWLPVKIFLSETLVKLRIRIISGNGGVIDVEDVHFPKLKILYLESVMFEEDDIGLSKLLSGCPVLEELVLDHISSCVWTSCTVSVATLKRLTCCCENTSFWEEGTSDWEMHNEPNIVSFDTPNLVYLEYAEVIADKYPKVNFDSLVEAKIDLWMTGDQVEEVRSRDNNASDEENNMVGNATDFIVGIRNVKVLYLSSDTLQVLMYCCKPIPIFKNLTQLTIKTNPKFGWEAVTKLLKNSPNLETLVFQGLHKAYTEEMDDAATCLSSSPVKVLKIFISDEEMEKQLENVKQFLETMPHLEQLVLYYDSSFDGDVKVSSQLQMVTRVTSPKCKLQLIPTVL